MENVIIIGNGPAGISTALYTTRAGFDTLVIGKDYGALGKAHEIENYYGFSKPISGNDLIKEGIEGAKRLGTTILTDEVLVMTYEDKFKVITKKGEYKADGVVLATGTSRNAPKIKGLNEFEGHGEHIATNIPGLYAAGDCTGGLLQISKAVYEGAKADTINVSISATLYEIEYLLRFSFTVHHSFVSLFNT